MNVQEITNKETWENFLAQCEEKTFMQSWYWGEFHERMDEKIWRFGTYEGNELSSVAFVAKIEAKRGTFLQVEHGPTTKNPKSRMLDPKQTLNFKFQILKTLLEKLKEIAKEERASFIRISPIWERNEENAKIFRELGFRNAPTYAAAESSWKLDITPSEDVLLTHMRKTTRYLIRQTLKNKDIEVIQSAKREDLEVFAALQREIAAHRQFVPFSKKYTEAEFDAFSQNNAIAFFFGRYKGAIAAAALIIFWSDIAFYHQAASRQEHTRFSIPYLVQWEAIKEAKKRGCKLYDFWGYVDPKQYPKHPWAGPTLFKMGFGGKDFEYVKTQDYPVSWKYWATAVFETIRRKQRRL